MCNIAKLLYFDKKSEFFLPLILMNFFKFKCPGTLRTTFYNETVNSVSLSKGLDISKRKP
jgi:hypothetical protein